MKLSEIKQILSTLDTISFVLPSGDMIPSHYHITEVGQVTKHFIDCGGTVRISQAIHFQLWTSIDILHRLTSDKLMSIISLSESKLKLPDLDIMVEYQGQTVEIYNLTFENNKFHLIPTATDCLAPNLCGLPTIKDISQSLKSCCDPASGCC